MSIPPKWKSRHGEKKNSLNMNINKREREREREREASNSKKDRTLKWQEDIRINKIK